MLRRLALSCALLAIASRAAADANNQVHISALSDVAFGTITNFSADAVSSQSLCVYAKARPLDNYEITASGSGAGGAFVLTSGSRTLPYEVQWSNSANQTSGTQLLANQALTGQHNNAAVDDCSTGPATTASLIVIVRSSALSAASSGTYTGTLTLLVAPE
jgi:hypothetical protein